MKTRRLQVLIEEDQHRRLAATAKHRGVSVATVVREAIDEKVAVSPDERRQAARRILSAWRMPVGDPEEVRAELEQLRHRRA